MRITSTILLVLLVGLAINAQTSSGPLREGALANARATDTAHLAPGGCSMAKVDLMGLRLRMTIVEARALVPGLRPVSSGRAGEVEARILPGKIPNRPEWKQVEVAVLHFLDGRLYSVNVVWEGVIPEAYAREFVAAQQKDKASEGWQPTSYGVSRVCGSDMIEFGVNEHPYASMTDGLAMAKMLQRREGIRAGRVNPRGVPGEEVVKPHTNRP